MIQILLCDDDKAVRVEIEKQISNQILIHQYDMKLVQSLGNPETLLSILKQMEQRENIYFLDVDLKHPAYDGFLLGQKIRELDPHGIIIYITSYKELAYKTFEYHLEAFDYIAKDPIDKISSAISQCLASISSRFRQAKESSRQYYTFRSGDCIRHIPFEDIYYLETSSKPHFLILHGKNQRIEFLGSLNEAAKTLGDSFMKIHRSYVVSLDKIEEINLKKNLVIVGGDCVSLSRKEKSKLLKRMNP